MSSNAPLFYRTSNGDFYAYELGAILQEGQRVWDPSYSLAQDPSIWEKAQQDTVVSGAIERSLLAVAGHDWKLEPASDNPEDVALTEILDAIIRKTERFYEARRNLAEARIVGTAFAQPYGGWQTTRLPGMSKAHPWWIPTRLLPIDRRRFRAIAHRRKRGGAFGFDWELYSPSRKLWEPLSPTFPIIKHVYADQESRLGFGRGVMDAIYFAYYIRSTVQKHGLQGLARWAQGLLVAKMDSTQSANPEEIADNASAAETLRDKLLEMIGDNILVIDKLDEVNVVTGGGEGYQMVEQMLDRVERELHARLEGSPLSSMDGDGGGAYALGKTHERREDSQRVYDRASLGESLKLGFVKYVRDVNLPTLRAIDSRLESANLPGFQVRDREEEDTVQTTEQVTKILGAGVALRKSEVYRRLGWERPEEGSDDVLEPPQQQDPMGGMGASPFGAMPEGGQPAQPAQPDMGALAAMLRAEVRAEIVGLVAEGRFDESKHKRDEGGKFSKQEGRGGKKPNGRGDRERAFGRGRRGARRVRAARGPWDEGRVRRDQGGRFSRQEGRSPGNGEPEPAAGDPEEASGAEPAGSREAPATPFPLDNEAEVLRQLQAALRPEEREPAGAQPFDSWDAALDMAAEAAPQYREILNEGQGLDAAMGAEVYDGANDPEAFGRAIKDAVAGADHPMVILAPLKGSKRSHEKVANKYGGDWGQLNDVVRGSVVVPQAGQLDETLNALREQASEIGWELTEAEDKISNPTPAGYRDFSVLLRSPEGFLCELQVMPTTMFAAKMTTGHKLYEQSRFIAEQASTRELTKEEESTVQGLRAKMRELYAGAWSSALGGATQPAPA